MRLQVIKTSKLGVLLGFFLVVASVLGGSTPQKANPPQLFPAKGDLFVEEKVDSLLRRMSLEEKVGQLLMPIVYPSSDTKALDETMAMLQTIHAGGILFQKGDAYDQYIMTQRLQRDRPVGLLIAADNEWGLAMRLANSIRYPRNRALQQCDVANIEQYGRDVAKQCKTIGIHIAFAPVLDINNNPQNPVIGTRSFGETASIVTTLGLAYARGLEAENVMSVAKHFPGHGNTHLDSHKTLPTISGSKQDLNNRELIPFKAFISEGLSGIMTAHLSVPAYDKRGTPASLSHTLTTSLLQEELGFGGLIFTDGLAMAGAQTASKLPLGVEALLAGNDILLGPPQPQKMYADIVEAVKRGLLTETLIEERCRKVLRAKWSLFGEQFFVSTPPTLSKNAFYKLLNEESLARRADNLWYTSITIERGEAFISSLRSRPNLAVGIVSLGRHAQRATDEMVSICRQLGIEPRFRLSVGTPEALPTEAILTKELAACEVILVNCFDRANSQFGKVIATLGKQKPTLFTLFASPYRLGSWERYLKHTTGVAKAYESCPEAYRATALRYFSASPKLPIVLPKQRQHSHEKEKEVSRQPLAYALPQRERSIPPLDAIAQEGLSLKAYPGCQVVAIHKGAIVYNKAFGRLTYEPTAPNVTAETLYDIASVTKSIALAPAIMRLVTDGSVKLSDRIAHHIPELKESEVGTTTLRELLLHEAGLPATINFYEALIDTHSLPEGKFFHFRGGKQLQQIDQSVWVPKNFSFNEQYLSPEACLGFTNRFSEQYFISDQFTQAVVLEHLQNLRLSRRGKRRYSDVGYILLGIVAERASGMPLDEYLQERLYRPMELERLTFRPLNSFPKDEIAPTQANNFLRGEVWGLVDDESAACLGGVAGNAGVFANALELAYVGYMLLEKGLWQEEQLIPEKIVELFLSTQGKDGRRSLGFVTGYKENPHLPNEASSSTFGHTGFTGTCLWIDPKKELVFVFLSNRTYPTRLNKRLSNEKIRPRLLEALYKAL